MLTSCRITGPIHYLLSACLASRAAQWCLLLVWALPLSVSAQTTLTVNTAQALRTVDEKVFGLNAVLWDANTASPQTISLLQAAGIRTIRIPGGSLSDEYHWRTNTTLANTWTWVSGFDDYATLITGLNAQTFVTVNYGTGTPEEAAAWVAYANASSLLLGTGADVAIGVDAKGYDWKTAGYWSNLRNSAPLGTDDGMNFLRIGRASPLGLKFWEIGNECYGTWETDQQVVPHDPYTYAVRAKLYIAKMKAVDPTIRIGVVAQPGENDNINNTSHPATNPRTGLVHNGWTPVMLTTLKATPAVTPDYLIYHRYEQAPAADQPGNPETDAGLLQKAATWPNDVGALRQQLQDYLGTTIAAGVELMITENNSVYAKPGKQTTSLVNGLYYADSLGNVLQTELNALLWWDLRNGQDNTNNNSASLYGWRQYGDYGVLSSVSAFGSSTPYDPYPTYYVMKLMSFFARQGDTVVTANSSNLLLSIFATRRTDGSLALLVINKDPTNSIAATITLTGFSPAGSATTYTYGKPQDTAAQTGSGSKDIATGTMSVGGTTFAASFASYSVTVMTVAQLVAPSIATQPASQSVSGGAPVTFSVTASGAPAPTYQWRKNSVDIPGATGSTLLIPNTASADQGSYTVVVANAGGSVTSAAATLTLSVPTNFDVAGYYARNADVAAAFGSDQLGAWLHFWNYGLAEGRQYDAQFIVGEYLLLNTDLTSAFGSDIQAALMHWLTYGKPVEDRIGRVPIGFNVDSYLARYPDLAAAFGAITPTAQRNVTVWNHYLYWGVTEGRSDGDFEAYNYLATNADLAAVFGTDVEAAALHWYFYGRREGRRIPANFSVTGYRTRNPDIVTVWGNDLYGSWLHYRDTGVYEGRTYDELFRVLEYRARYADVQAAYGNNLTGVLNHWLFYGKPEGRLGRNP